MREMVLPETASYVGGTTFQAVRVNHLGPDVISACEIDLDKNHREPEETAQQVKVLGTQA